MSNPLQSPRDSELPSLLILLLGILMIGGGTFFVVWFLVHLFPGHLYLDSILLAVIAALCVGEGPALLAGRPRAWTDTRFLFALFGFYCGALLGSRWFGLGVWGGVLTVAIGLVLASAAYWALGRCFRSWFVAPPRRNPRFVWGLSGGLVLVSALLSLWAGVLDVRHAEALKAVASVDVHVSVVDATTGAPVVAEAKVVDSRGLGIFASSSHDFEKSQLEVVGGPGTNLVVRGCANVPGEVSVSSTNYESQIVLVPVSFASRLTVKLVSVPPPPTCRNPRTNTVSHVTAPAAQERP